MNVPELVSESNERVASRMCHIPSPLFNRALLFDDEKGDKESKEAAAAASKGDWDKALTVWLKRIETRPFPWKELYNCGVEAERRKDYPLAKIFYEKAQIAAKNVKEKNNINWADLIQSLTWVPLPLSNPSNAIAWFSKKWAVLPFSDETVSLAASDMVRTHVAGLLSGFGYSILPIGASDEILKSKGISEGGQLSAFNKSDLFKWLCVDHILYGHVTAFEDANIGLVRTRSVGGTLTLCAGDKKEPLWENEGKIANEIWATNKKDILTNLLGGLVEKWVEHATNSPLVAESELYARKVLASLPAKPQKKS